MPRESTASGMVKLRQAYTREGQSHCIVSMPSTTLALLGWEAGIYLAYYPTQGGELVFVPQGQLFAHVSPDYDRRADAAAEPMKSPIKGSMADRMAQIDAQYNKMEDDLAAAFKKEWFEGVRGPHEIVLKNAKQQAALLSKRRNAKLDAQEKEKERVRRVEEGPKEESLVDMGRRMRREEAAKRHQEGLEAEAEYELEVARLDKERGEREEWRKAGMSEKDVKKASKKAGHRVAEIEAAAEAEEAKEAEDAKQSVKRVFPQKSTGLGPVKRKSTRGDRIKRAKKYGS